MSIIIKGFLESGDGFITKLIKDTAITIEEKARTEVFATPKSRLKTSLFYKSKLSAIIQDKEHVLADIQEDKVNVDV